MSVFNAAIWLDATDVIEFYTLLDTACKFLSANIYTRWRLGFLKVIAPTCACALFVEIILSEKIWVFRTLLQSSTTWKNCQNKDVLSTRFAAELAKVRTDSSEREKCGGEANAFTSKQWTALNAAEIGTKLPARYVSCFLVSIYIASYIMNMNKNVYLATLCCKMAFFCSSAW